MKIAVIPARGGSKRIPRKNIRPFAGRPMIAYAIDAALQSALFEHVIVSTDDPEIADAARALGAMVPFVRPAELSDDHTPTVPVIAHAVSQCRALGWPVTLVCCLYPAIPLVRPQDISAAMRLLEAHDNVGYTFPVTPFPSAIQRALKRATDGRVEPFNPEYVNVRTQDLEPACHDAGQFYWAAAATWLAGLPVHANGRAIVLPNWRVVDIDTSEDWDRAEALYAALSSRG